MRADIKSGAVHPRTAKVNLAKFLVRRFHGEKEAEEAAKEFDEIFVNKGFPTEIPEFSISASHEPVWICHLLAQTQMCASTSEARRMIQSQAVEMDGTKVSDEKLKLDLKSGQELLLKVGKKKFLKVKVQ